MFTRLRISLLRLTLKGIKMIISLFFYSILLVTLISCNNHTETYAQKKLDPIDNNILSFVNILEGWTIEDLVSHVDESELEVNILLRKSGDWQSHAKDIESKLRHVEKISKSKYFWTFTVKNGSVNAIIMIGNGREEKEQVWSIEVYAGEPLTTKLLLTIKMIKID